MGLTFLQDALGYFRLLLSNKLSWIWKQKLWCVSFWCTFLILEIARSTLKKAAQIKAEKWTREIHERNPCWYELFIEILASVS